MHAIYKICLIIGLSLTLNANCVDIEYFRFPKSISGKTLVIEDPSVTDINIEITKQGYTSHQIEVTVNGRQEYFGARRLIGIRQLNEKLARAREEVKSAQSRKRPVVLRFEDLADFFDRDFVEVVIYNPAVK